MKNPLVSVVIPTYNSSNYIANAIDSVLGQSVTDIEVVIVDDGSDDNTRDILRPYGRRLTYLYQKNAGVSVARNKGISAAKGKYLAFLDADDTWRPYKLERQLSALDGRPDCSACYSAFELGDSKLAPVGVVQSERYGSAIEDLLTRGNAIGTPSTVICERSLFAKAGGFDSKLSQCADWDMWLRLSVLTDFLYIGEPLVTYRQHGSNMSRDTALLERDSLLVLSKGFDLPNLPKSLRVRRRAAFARNYTVLAGSYFQAGRYMDFARCASRAIALDFRQLVYFASYPSRLLARSGPSRATETA